MSHSVEQERRVLDLAVIGLADVPVFGRYEYTAVRPGLETHTHPESVEICYLERGSQTYRAGGREYHLVGGDLFVTKPGEPHDTGGYAEDRGILYWVNFKMPKRGHSLLMMPPEESRALKDKLLALPGRQFAGRPSIKQMFNEVFHLCEQPVGPLIRVAVVNELLRLILEVIHCAQDHSGAHQSPPIVRIVEQIRTAPERNYRLDELAVIAGLSLSRFKAKFKSQMGLAPREFIIRCKVDAAKKLLLEEHRAVTQTAMQLGFSSSQYFATVFKRFTHKTPSEFQAHGPAVPLRRSLPFGSPATRRSSRKRPHV